MLLYINILKCLGILLIVNSHMDNIYPVSSLATGGAIGNALFFLCSGYCLNEIKDTFFVWYRKRLIRIYPLTWAITLALLLIGYIKISAPFDVIKYFIYPTNYWFIGAIAIFYLIYYFVIKSDYNKYLFYSMLVISVILYGITYFVNDTSKWIVEDNIITRYIFYFWVMVLGGYLRRKNITIDKIKLWHPLICVIIYFALKFLMLKSELFMNLQFITQLITYIIVILLLLYLKNKEDYLKKEDTIFKKGFIKSVNYFSSLSLEIYLIHIPAMYYCSKISFPVNFITLIVITLLLSSIVNYIFKLIFSQFKKRRLI